MASDYIEALKDVLSLCLEMGYQGSPVVHKAGPCWPTTISSALQDVLGDYMENFYLSDLDPSKCAVIYTKQGLFHPYVPFISCLAWLELANRKHVFLEIPTGYTQDAPNWHGASEISRVLEAAGYEVVHDESEITGSAFSCADGFISSYVGAWASYELMKVPPELSAYKKEALSYLRIRWLMKKALAPMSDAACKHVTVFDLTYDAFPAFDAITLGAFDIPSGYAVCERKALAPFEYLYVPPQLAPDVPAPLEDLSAMVKWWEKAIKELPAPDKPIQASPPALRALSLSLGTKEMFDAVKAGVPVSDVFA